MMPAISQASSLHLGELAPDVATVERMVHDRVRLTGEPLMLFADYCDAVGNLPRLAREARQTALDARQAASSDWRDVAAFRASERARDRLYVRGEGNPALAGLIEASQRVQLTPDFEGWVRYLGTQGPIQQAFRSGKYQQQSPFHEAGLIDSVLVVAPRGWGKSELLKAIIRHDVQPPNDARPRASLVIIDPGNNLARQVARWREMAGSDRLVYIEPELRPGLTVGINPLDGTGLDHVGRNEAATMLAEALDANTAPLSMNMETLIIHCGTVLMSLPGATLRDFRAMLGDPAEDQEAAALYDKALAYPDPDVRAFFARDFLHEASKGSKVWLAARLQRLFADHHLASMFGGSQTVNLRAAIAARKAVVINLAPMKAETTIGIAGRLLTAAIGGVIRARNPDDPALAPVQLVVDEVTMVAGGGLVRMLAQLRKYGLNMVLGQQVMASGFAPEDKATLLQNTGCRFIGGVDRNLIRDMLVLGRDVPELPAVRHRQFWAMWRGDGPLMLNVRDDLAGNSLGVDEVAWQGFVARITGPGGYYRPAKPEPLPEPAPMRPAPAKPRHAEDASSNERGDQGSHVPTDVGSMEPTNPATVSAVKIGLKRQGGKSRAKPADVVVRDPKSRPSKALKPLVKKAKPADVKPSGRKLDADDDGTDRA